MTTLTTPLLVILAILLLIPAAVVITIYAFKGMAFLVKQVGAFVFGMIGDTLRLIGVLVTVPILSLLVVANIVIGRWSAAGHFGRGVADEVRTFGTALYRLVIGHPARLLCLTPLTEGLERRLPEIMAAAPGPDKPSRRMGTFEGYTITGSLPGGGSGGKLYIATPDERKRGAFLRQGLGEVQQVVIKAFHLHEGSSLPQIVRESRSLDSARKMGLVLEHELSEERFYYVMRYAPGESLTRVTQQMHAMTGGQGLSKRDLRKALGYARDLLDTLAAYHAGGLWHKDVKPDNIIVGHDDDGERARLVDFGLITHLRSAMTLTTHGTEYFRDPEMVRMALRGVKVNEVDGQRFDVFAAGAVLYSMIENGFPAHGGLSRISQPCPEAIRWIIRRAMADYEKRYGSALEMLADLDFVLRAPDMFAVTTAQLPSMGAGASVASALEADTIDGHREHAFAGTSSPKTPPPLPATPQAPRLRLLNWWTGAFQVGGHDDAPLPGVAVRVGTPSPAAMRASDAAISGGKGTPKTAREQVSSARRRARERQRRAHERRRSLTGNRSSGARLGIGLAIVLVVLPAIAASLLTVRYASFKHGPRIGGTYLTPSVPIAPVAPAPPSVHGLAEHEATTLARLKDVDGKLLVVRDATGLSPEQRTLLESRLAALRDAGVEVLDAHNSATEDLPKITELLAQVRRSIGVAEARSPASGERISHWLEQNGEIDVVYWIAPDERDATRANPVIVASGDRGQTILNALRQMR